MSRRADPWLRVVDVVAVVATLARLRLLLPVVVLLAARAWFLDEATDLRACCPGAIMSPSPKPEEREDRSLRRFPPRAEGSVRLYWGVVEDMDGFGSWLGPTRDLAVVGLLVAGFLTAVSPETSNGDMLRGFAIDGMGPSEDGLPFVAPAGDVVIGDGSTADTGCVEARIVDTPTDDTVPPWPALASRF